MHSKSLRIPLCVVSISFSLYDFKNKIIENSRNSVRFFKNGFGGFRALRACVCDHYTISCEQAAFSKNSKTNLRPHQILKERERERENLRWIVENVLRRNVVVLLSYVDERQRRQNRRGKRLVVVVVVKRSNKLTRSNTNAIEISQREGTGEEGEEG